jgi:hypothetical protein
MERCEPLPEHRTRLEKRSQILDELTGEVRFANDSPVEGSGFELVPLRRADHF